MLPPRRVLGLILLPITGLGPRRAPASWLVRDPAAHPPWKSMSSELTSVRGSSPGRALRVSRRISAMVTGPECPFQTCEGPRNPRYAGLRRGPV